ncbi:MAG: hypothetical protein J0I84_21555 [Terrimonas sp.]|nr:hypothetical protein [Terrimonas sp.]
MKNSLIKLIMLLLAAVVHSGCKKEKDKEPAPQCRLSLLKIPNGNGTTSSIVFNYDSIGRITALNLNGTITQFIYHSKGFTKITPISAGWFSRSHLELDDNGRPKLSRDTTFNGTHINSTGTVNYEYNSAGQLEKILRKRTNDLPDKPPLTTLFSWSNGNITGLNHNNEPMVLDYETDKPNQDFSYIELSFIGELGAYAPRSKNLVKSVTSTAGQLLYSYEFDNWGKTTASYWTQPDSNILLKIDYEYDCD